MRHAFDVEGKVAIVTGASSGIGAATAKRLSAAGAKVWAADVVEPMQSEGIRYRYTDVADPAQMAALCNEVVANDGRLDVMVNNAAVSSSHPIAEADATRAERFWRVNQLSVVSGIKEAAARMQAGGSIINISSITAVRGFFGWGEYAATKGAIIALTQTAAVEYGPAGIRVNCICPGIIDTPMALAEAADIVKKSTALFSQLGRVGRPEEVAAAIHFLASDDAGYVTGQSLLVDGGWSTGTSLKAMTLVNGG